MCLILLAIKSHPVYDLIIAANRDEFYHRPTADASFWDDHPHVLAGRDLNAMGTWMGVNLYGQTAMITNYRDLKNIKPQAPSRGKLVADFLIDKALHEDEYLENLKVNSHQYNGYNLLFGTRDMMVYYSNVSNHYQKLSSGIFGLSNHFLDTDWPKVERGKKALKTLINKNDELEPEGLFEALYDDIKAPDHLLPDTGVGMDMEKMLSPIFIKSPDYGSRCSTILLADKKGNWYFYERVYNVKDFSFRTNEFSFREK